MKPIHDEEFDFSEGQSMRSPYQVTYNRSLPYRKFLKTLYWQYVREQVYKNCRHRYKCEDCGKNDSAVDIHHKTYAHQGDELNHLEDLRLLCRVCHERHHRDNPDLRPIKPIPLIYVDDPGPQAEPKQAVDAGPFELPSPSDLQSPPPPRPPQVITQADVDAALEEFRRARREELARTAAEEKPVEVVK